MGFLETGWRNAYNLRLGGVRSSGVRRADDDMLLSPRGWRIKLLLSAALGAAIATWGWASLSLDQKPAAMFLIARDQ